MSVRRQLISCPGPREWPVSPRRAVQSSGKLTNAATAAALHEPDENSSSPLSLSLSFKSFVSLSHQTARAWISAHLYSHHFGGFNWIKWLPDQEITIIHSLCQLSMELDECVCSRKRDMQCMEGCRRLLRNSTSDYWFFCWTFHHSYMNVNIITVWCGVQDFQPPAAKNEKSCVAAPSSWYQDLEEFL